MSYFYHIGLPDSVFPHRKKKHFISKCFVMHHDENPLKKYFHFYKITIVYYIPGHYIYQFPYPVRVAPQAITVTSRPPLEESRNLGHTGKTARKTLPQLKSDRKSYERRSIGEVLLLVLLLCHAETGFRKSVEWEMLSKKRHPWQGKQYHPQQPCWTP